MLYWIPPTVNTQSWHVCVLYDYKIELSASFGLSTTDSKYSMDPTIINNLKSLPYT
jgi:hypothetical protein